MQEPRMTSGSDEQGVDVMPAKARFASFHGSGASNGCAMAPAVRQPPRGRP